MNVAVARRFLEHRLSRGWLFALVLAVPAWADWHPALPDGRLVGSGDFTWFGVNLYTARLWSAGLPLTWDQPFALELTYHRVFSRETLVEASLKEMRRMAEARPDESTLQRWSSEMREAFVDVRPGMRITGIYHPGIGCTFFVDGQLRRRVEDPAFARAFFDIWLDPRTRDKQLRQQLLGMDRAAD
ncbi:hypothetical protein J2Y86_000975 [Pseudomonas migulae]|uniref:chalcone isomerase family protein n=1 Tax=Pseudomonas migulae TaxID=78543 RepID=UPI00209F0CD2|nr:chalcone isomerase family protein [Pseudomonas migulae]MCP1496268.1 hypothetical protein [Pseudomonas migulae]